MGRAGRALVIFAALVAAAAALVFALRSGSSTTTVIVRAGPTVVPTVVSPPTTTTTTTAATLPVTTARCAFGQDVRGTCYDVSGVNGPHPPGPNSYDQSWYCKHPPDPDGIDRSGNAFCSGFGGAQPK